MCKAKSLHIIRGELPSKQWTALLGVFCDFYGAIAHLERAVRLEDAVAYTEPAEWHYPPREALAAVLLEAKRPAEAETSYWADLKRNRNNGWSLYGLMKALQAQGNRDEAALVEAGFKKAWERADVTITDSRFALQGTTAQKVSGQ